MKNAIIIFTRVPIAGQTKTRLMPFLTPEECEELHREMILDVYKACSQVDAHIFIFYTPKEYEKKLKTILGDVGSYYPQEGEDLGQRMSHAIDIVLTAGYEKAILMGTDIPQISPSILEEAFSNLNEAQVVINPTEDGGYYLIGMGKNYPEAWSAKKYGTNTVIEDTVHHMEEAGITVKLGEVCRDIDTKEDLLYFYDKKKCSEEAFGDKTYRYLEQKLRGKCNER